MSKLSSDSQLLTTARARTSFAIRNSLDMLQPTLALDGFKAAHAMKPRMKNLGRLGCDDIEEIDARMAKIRKIGVGSLVAALMQGLILGGLMQG
jgi:hypothetical protein